MQRFKQPNMDLHPDGEWIRYADHVEAMKRIAGDGGQAERCNCCGYLVTESEHRGCLRAAAPAGASPAELTEMTTEQIEELWEKETGFGMESSACIAEADILGFARALLAASPADQVEDARNLLTAASHALRSYQYGNSAPDLAESIADRIDVAMSASKEGA